MISHRRHEGYLMIDDRASGGRLFEAPTYTCNHCKDVVILNPLRNRDRPYCVKCDHRICDRCKSIQIASGGKCQTFSEVIDQVIEAAALGKSPSPIILLP